MAKRMTLAFGVITVRRTSGSDVKGPELLRITRRAVDHSKFRVVGRGSTTKRGFMPPEGGYDALPDHLLVCYAYEQGDEFTSIDEKTKEFKQVKYPEIPYQSRALFVVNEDGTFVMQRAATPYIGPDRLMDQLQEEIRESVSSEDLNITVRALEFHETYASTVEFILELSELREIQFTNIRHSNPESRDEKLDKISDMNVDELTERATRGDGIRRDSPEFQAQLEHAKRYAEISRASGRAGTEFSELSVVEGVPEVTIAPEAEDPVGVAKAMLAAFRRIRSRLRRRGPEPL